MNSINVAVIGCGYWGPNLIRNLVDLPQTNLVAVADKREDRLSHISALYPQVQMISDYRLLFQMGIDAVVVATPPASHFAIARDCLEHGLNVLVEKPLTLRTDHAEELVRLAAERGLKLMVGNTFEYNAAVHTLKQLVESGELGEIYYVNAVRTNLGLYRPSVNAMWDLAPHDISILMHILGEEPASVSAQGGAFIFGNIYDVVYLHLKFHDRLLAHIHVSWLDPCKVRRITVIGSKKMAVYDDIENLEKIKIYDRSVEAPPYTDSFADFQCSYRYGDIVIPHIQFVEPLRAECAHFAEAIMNDTEPRSDGVVGMRIVSILESASKSLEEGGSTVLVPPMISPVSTPEVISAQPISA